MSEVVTCQRHILSRLHDTGWMNKKIREQIAIPGNALKIAGLSGDLGQMSAAVRQM